MAQPSAVLTGGDSTDADARTEVEMIIEARASRNSAQVTERENFAESMKQMFGLIGGSEWTKQIVNFQFKIVNVLFSDSNNSGIQGVGDSDIEMAFVVFEANVVGWLEGFDISGFEKEGG